MTPPPLREPGDRDGRIKVLLAFYSHPRFRTVADRIYRELGRYGELIVHRWDARDPGDPLLRDVTEKILESDAFVAVVTEGSLRPVLESLVRLRAGITGAKEHSYLFVSRSLKRTSGFLSEASANVVFFDEKELPALKRQIDLVARDLLAMVDVPTVLHMRKKVLILGSGLGIVSSERTVRVSSRPEARVQVLRARWGITADAARRAGLKLAPADKLWDRGLRARQKPPAFVARVLSHMPDDLTIVDIRDHSEQQESLSRSFDLCLSRALTPNEIVRYSWGFTFPSLFKPYGADCSSIGDTRGIQSLTYEVSFETDPRPDAFVDFAEPPSLILYDSEGRQLAPRQPAPPQRGLYRTTFLWENIANVAGRSVRVEWNRTRTRPKGQVRGRGTTLPRKSGSHS